MLLMKPSVVVYIRLVRKDSDVNENEGVPLIAYFCACPKLYVVVFSMF